MYKSPDGYRIGVAEVDYSTVKSFRALNRFSKVWLKPILVALLFILGIAIYNEMKPAGYTLDDMQNYAVVYLNNHR